MIMMINNDEFLQKPTKAKCKKQLQNKPESENHNENPEVVL